MSCMVCVMRDGKPLLNPLGHSQITEINLPQLNYMNLKENHMYAYLIVRVGIVI